MLLHFTSSWMKSSIPTSSPLIYLSIWYFKIYIVFMYDI